MKKSIYLSITVILLTIAAAEASVFDIFGSGSTDYGYNGEAAGRGYTGLASSDSTHMPGINPASAAFVYRSAFEAGISADMSLISGGVSSQYQGFRQVALSVPAGKNGGLLFSMLPATSAEGGMTVLRNDINASESYYQSGGIYVVSVTYARKLSRNSALGFRYGAGLGGYELRHDVDFTADDMEDVYFLRSSGVDSRHLALGLQSRLFGKMDLGLIWDKVLSGESRSLLSGGAASYSSTVFAPADTVFTDGAVFNDRIGAGISLPLKGRLLLKADALLSYNALDMSANRFGINPDFSSGSAGHIGIGIELPSDRTVFRNFFQRIDYRAGLFSDSEYLTAESGAEYSSKGVTLGMSIPLNKGFAAIDIAFTAGIRNGTLYNELYPSGNTLDENFYSFKLFFRSSDRWFNTKGKYR